MFWVIQFYRLTQLIFSTLLKHPVICNDNDKRRYVGGKTFFGVGFIFKDYLVLTIGKFSVISYPLWKRKKALFLKG